MNFRDNQELWEMKSLSRRAKKSSQAYRTFDEGKDPLKTEYQKDIDRIIKSDAFFNLRYKSQICLSLTPNNLLRNRLSHTLEVAQVAKAISKSLELNCELVEAIALGHDLGQTPFGHAGEKALNQILKDRKRSFNHNVQSVWVVDQYTTVKYTEFSDGLNLTYDTLEGLWKHRKYKGQVLEYEARLRELSPDSSGSLESKVVMYADMITRCVHDLFDANQSRVLTYERFDEEFWSDSIRVPFNPNTWQQFFIHDLIKNSFNTDDVSMSAECESIFEQLKDYLNATIFASIFVLEYDVMCRDVLSKLYDYYEHHFEWLLKANPRYQAIYNAFGEERVLIDHLQSLSDKQAYEAYDMIGKTRVGLNAKRSSILEL
ncbi:MAG TPA: hypothetical protein DCS67_10710 [Clostridiales bacterium UBA8960]|jgi:dGTPase|nr:hypothetical protein [Clostridiales bacterium UBA8960]